MSGLATSAGHDPENRLCNDQYIHELIVYQEKFKELDKFRLWYPFQQLSHVKTGSLMLASYPPV